MHKLADILVGIGSYEEAIEILAVAHERRAQVLGEDDINTQTSRHLLASLYFATNNQAQAAELYFRWLESRKRTHGDDNPQRWNRFVCE